MELDIEKIGDLSPSQLSECITRLIETDQPALVHLLYRLDVSEEKIRHALLNNAPHLAGDTLSLLIIERLEQRVRNRALFPRSEEEIPENDRW